MQGTEKLIDMQNSSCIYKLNCSWVLLTEVIVLHPFESLVHLNVKLQKGTIINLSTTNGKAKSGYFGNYLMVCIMMTIFRDMFPLHQAP